MKIEKKTSWPSSLPENDDHPYRTGAWKPQLAEYDATDLDVVSGEIPKDLEGVYLRNTENPVLSAIGRYHPFDGDGMVHAIHFANGKVDYRNRFVRTSGLLAELEAREPLWAGGHHRVAEKIQARRSLRAQQNERCVEHRHRRAQRRSALDILSMR